jgi:uncharacterized protein involved in type VI secretion and phage assembly
VPSYDPDQLLKLGMMSALVVGDGDKEVDVDEMGGHRRADLVAVQ